MAEFKKGQRVRVELEGIVGTVDSEGVYIHPVKDKSYAHFLWTEHIAKVTLLDPAGWPPQVGDIWEAEGAEYFVQDWPPEVIIHPAKISRETYSYRNDKAYMKGLDDFKSLNPVLVRRRGQ